MSRASPGQHARRMINTKFLPPRLREPVYRWWGFRPVTFGGFNMRVLPYDKQFWDGVNAGTWEPETIEVLASVIKRGSAHCDIGAWIGPTVLFAHRSGANVTCFEPDPLAYERLLGNLRLNGAFDVRTIPCALGGKDGLRTMGAMVGSLGKSATSFFGTGAAQTVQVPCLTWETAVRIFQLPVFDTMKIDIEGAEVEVLPLLLDYLREHRPALLLSTHWSFLPEPDRKRLSQSLSELGKIYPSVVALGDSGRQAADLSDPLTPSRQAVFLLKSQA